MMNTAATQVVTLVALRRHSIPCRASHLSGVCERTSPRQQKQRARFPEACTFDGHARRAAQITLDLPPVPSVRKATPLSKYDFERVVFVFLFASIDIHFQSTQIHFFPSPIG
jgi:hypothetical protein